MAEPQNETYWHEMAELYADERNELLEQLAETQADVRALVAAIEEPTNSADLDGYSTAWARALARPGVQRMMEDTSYGSF